MDEKTIQSKIDNLNDKIDIILQEIDLQRKQRQEIEDLKEDLLRVGVDMYETAVDELEEMHDQINTGDIFYLFKKLLRNVNNITKSLEQIENLKDFLSDFGPVSRQMTIDFMDKLDELDRKGYFDFFRELNRALDNIIKSFAVDDVKSLAEHSPIIIRTAKNLTEPALLNKINRTIETIKNSDINNKNDVSFFKLLSELNSKEVRNGLALAINILKIISSENQQLKK